jgi:hypothetical protein
MRQHARTPADVCRPRIRKHNRPGRRLHEETAEDTQTGLHRAVQREGTLPGRKNT